MSSLVEYVASKVGATIGILIFIIVVLLAIPGGYNLYLQTLKSRDEKNNTKYIFDDTGYDTSGAADIISMICAAIMIIGIFGTVISVIN